MKPLLWGLTFVALLVIPYWEPLYAASQSRVQLIVGSTVQVSSDNPDLWHIEDYAGADPTNAHNLIACSIMEPRPPQQNNDDTTVAYISSDGGSTWHQTYTVSPSFSSGDPACGFTSDGKPMFSALRFWPVGNVERTISGNDEAGNADLAFLVLDHGAWQLTRLTEADREFIITRSGIKHKQTIYLVWRIGRYGSVFGKSPTALNVYRSQDGGKSFSIMSAYMYSPHMAAFGQGGTFSDGSLIVPIADSATAYPFPNAGLIQVVLPQEAYSQASVPGPITVSKQYLCGSCGWNSTYYVPSLTVDDSHSRYRDRAYLAWTDHRNGRWQAVIARSSDRGRTWSKPVIVSDYTGVRPDSLGPDDANPVMAVNRDGILGVMWYDRRNQPNDIDWQARFAVSTDGGATFSRSVALTTETNDFNRRWQHLAAVAEAESLHSAQQVGGKRCERRAEFAISLAVESPKASGGETSGLSVDADGIFHAFWLDNRTGVDQLWTTTVRVNTGSRLEVPAQNLVRRTAWHVYTPPISRSDQRACGPEKHLAPVDNVTLDLGHAWLDRATGVASADVYAVNTTGGALAMPLVFRVASVNSKMGSSSEAIDASGNAVPRPCWIFTTANHTVSLAPEQASNAVHLVFKINDLRRATLQGFGQAGHEYINLKGTLYLRR